MFIARTLCLAIVSALFIGNISAQEKLPGVYPNPDRFEMQIAEFEESDKTSPPPTGAVLCYGSSSIRYWHKDLAEDLAPLTVIPRGFGGSNMNDALHFADRAVLPYKPRAILLYEGDNDIGAGVSPEEVIDTFRKFVTKVHSTLPDTRIYIIAIKPSILRWRLWPQIQKTNELFAAECNKNDKLTYIDIATPMLTPEGLPRPELLCMDRLHMNRQGYELWRDIVQQILVKNEGQYENAKSFDSE